MVFFKFFPIFLEFSITRQVGTEQDDSFYFHHLSAFPPIFWLEMKPSQYFIIFSIFLLFVWNFLLRIGQERSETIICIFVSFSAISNQFLLEKKPQQFISNFLNFFCNFHMNFLLRVGLESNGMIIFIFPVSRSIPTYYVLK